MSIKTSVDAKKIISIIISSLCLLQCLFLWFDYFETYNELKNPLIPKVLIEKIFQYTVFLSMSYFILACVSLLAIWTKTFWGWISIVFSIAGFILLRYFAPDIIKYFIEN